MILLIFVLVFLPFFIIQLFSVATILTVPRKKKNPSKPQIKVSLLLAARNEEALIARSLDHILALDYPSNLLEIIVGNDQSSDRTKEIVQEYQKTHPQIQLHDVTSNVGKGRGKANVLAHLAHKATGEFFFITDVDVALPSAWIKEILAEFSEDVGIVSGTSTCERSDTLFSRMQSIDWLHFMGYMQSFANVGVGCTSVGNNMAVRSKAYWQTGGFENIPFSITEDYKLFEAVTNNGWQWRSVLTPASLGLAWPIGSVKEMLHQRKRWLIGAGDLPHLWKFLIVLYGLFIPGLIALFFVNPVLASQLWFAKFVIQTIYIHVLAQKVGLRSFSFLNLCFYELYVVLNTLATAVFYGLPIASVWKGRTYSKDNLA
jgi:cellulose synthase/poly-beta-1,6-N-acetylglucosamine synthase-like glycosyltransferase